MGGGGHPLPQHLGRRLDGGHCAIRRLVGARSGADIDNGGGGAQRGVDLRRNAVVRTTVLGVADADPVVQRRSHCATLAFLAAARARGRTCSFNAARNASALSTRAVCPASASVTKVFCGAVIESK